MRKILAFFMALSVTCATGFSLQAQEIRDIETTVSLFSDGHARVVQIWDVTVVDGTEWYIPIDNLGECYIHDFQVSENGIEYENDGRKWNSNRSLAAKTHRCGIVEKRGGNIELCWGQGEYGDHVYTISYTIDNLVQSYDECDGFHWHFLNDEWEVRPQHASIRIVNETGGDAWYWNDQNTNNVRFWGFGMVGDSRLEDGTIYFESTEPFRYGSFFSALVSFDKGLFSPLVEGAGTFEQLRKEAMEGSDYDDGKMPLSEKILAGILILLVVILPLAIVLYLIFALFRRIYRRISGRRYDKKIFGTDKITGWWRNIPLDGSPTSLYSLLLSGDLLKPDKNKMFSNLVSAYFLKWIQDGLLVVEKDPRKKDRVNLRFVKDISEAGSEDVMENTVYCSALQAAGNNRILEADEFKSWSYKHDKTVAGWPLAAKASGQAGWKEATTEERCHAIEFKNFLEDFTIMSERDAPEVGLWKKYMVMAASLGVAEKVSRNFEKLFPKLMEEYVQQTNMIDMTTTYYVLRNLNRSSSAMMSSAMERQAQRAARAAAAQRSSGGGGSISFGGGGGGFGGGHGGGSR